MLRTGLTAVKRTIVVPILPVLVTACGSYLVVHRSQESLDNESVLEMEGK
jgi:hypothetical protein